MTMVQGTTPALLLTVEGVDLTDMTVEVVIRRRSELLTLTGDRLTVASDGTDTTIGIRLTQQETLSMRTGSCEVQARWIDAQGVAQATYPPVAVRVGEYLRPAVIEYEGA